MGSFAIATYNHKVLMLLRDPDDSWGNHWCWVGGGAEIGETPEQTLIREAKEEANLDLGSYTYLFEFESQSHPGLIHHVFHVPLTKEDIESMKLGDEGQKLELFAYDEFEALPLTPTFKKALISHKHLFKDTSEYV